jgi:cell division transport system permease protein
MKKKRSFKSKRFINSKITATISISLVLFLFGLVILISLFANNFSDYIKETISFDIELDDSVSEKQVSQLLNTLNHTSFVKSTEYISKEAAAKQVAADLDQNMEEFLGFNPLPAIISVNLNAQYANTDSLAVIENQIKGYSGTIQKIVYQKDLLQIANNDMRKISLVILAVAFLLLFISYALISSTIRLMIYSKRFLIHTMKLVGAKSNFIRKPYLVSGVISGIVAAFIAMGLIIWLLYYVNLWLKYYLNQSIDDFATLINLNSLLIVGGSILVLGILISVLATYMAVNKYIRMDNDDLYYI